MEASPGARKSTGGASLSQMLHCRSSSCRPGPRRRAGVLPGADAWCVAMAGTALLQGSQAAACNRVVSVRLCRLGSITMAHAFKSPELLAGVIFGHAAVV